MGRIDEALRRVAETDRAELDATQITPAGDAFVSPWSFAPEGDDPAPQAEAAGTPAPVASPAWLPPAGGAVLDLDSRLAVFRGFAPEVAERLVVGDKTPPLVAEQFRRLAALLHHAQLVNGTKVIMITSALAGDGKSFTATNLALTLSESYRRRVLLIDADLRRPTLHETFRVPNVAGLNEGLKASDDQQLSALKITDTLTLLPAGRPEPDPMGGLSSTRMRRILEEAAARFDWVVIDTAPVGLLADANVVSTMVDGALLVVRAQQTPHAAVVKALEALGRDRVLGVVLNGAAAPPGPAYEARYYQAPVEETAVDRQPAPRS